MPEPRIPWAAYALARTALGVFGCLSGLVLEFVFVAIWHWVALFILWQFTGRGSDWVYAWDALFLVFLAWEGHRYKQRMPPRSPFTQFEQVIAVATTGHTLATPAQMAYGISEILYVAPRLFFWGWKHLLCITLPSDDVARQAAAVHALLKMRASGTPFEQVKTAFPTGDIAERSVALLVKAGIATGSVSEGVLRFRAVDPEWV